MLQHKSFTDTQRQALEQFSLWSKTGQSLKLQAVIDHFSLPFFKLLAAAAIAKNITTMEEDLKLPKRAGKTVISLAADSLAHYLKTQDLRVH